MKEIILSHFQAKALLEARASGASSAMVSPDLGISVAQVQLEARGARFNQDELLSWEAVASIAASPSVCYVLEHGEAKAIQFYSQEAQRLYSLYPTGGAPSMLVSGVPMHRVKGTSPDRDTQEKIRAIKPVVGQVLDTATGLGYTAIQAARTGEQVITVEVERDVLEVCRLNPWSQELFHNPKITQMIGDSCEVIAGFPAGRFSRVIHDPPAFNLAGDLYSGEFYRELYRVLNNHGRLYHYVGDPESKSGHSITAGVMRRLEQAGFRQVRRAPRAFGVVALK
ncbi:MAG: class I SAM-dependent methyltransferase [Acidobacteriaceae bacterium]